MIAADITGLPLFEPLKKTETKAIQWIERPRDARIGRIVNKRQEYQPVNWPPSSVADFCPDPGEGVLQEWPLGQFHEFQLIQIGEGAYHLQNFLPERMQIALINCYRDSLCKSGMRMTPPKQDGNIMRVGTVSLGWQWHLGRGYSEPQTELPSLIFDLSQLAIKACGANLPLLAHPLLCSGIIQHYDCLKNPKVALGMHTDDDESPDVLKRGTPIVSWSLGCDADFMWEEVKNKILLKSGDCIVFGGASRLAKHGIHKVIPHTEPQFLKSLEKPLSGRTNLTIRLVKGEFNHG